MKCTAELLLVTAAGLSAMPADAGVIGFASLEELRFSLVDLNPADGIAPALTWIPDPNASSVGAHVGTAEEYLTARAPFQLMSTSFNDGLRAGTAVNRLEGAYAWMKSSVTLDTPSASVSNTVAASVAGPTYGWSLTPYTQLLIEAKMHAVVAVTELNWRGDRAGAVVSMNLTQPSAGGSPTDLGAVYTNAVLSWDPSDPNSEVFTKESFVAASILWANEAPNAAVLGFSFSVWVSGESKVTGQPAIPEPTSWLLFCAGMLPVWLAVRRTKRRSVQKQT